MDDTKAKPEPKIAAGTGTAAGQGEARADGRAWPLDRRLTADLARGAKVIESARQGHEAVHGTPEKRRERWLRYVDGYCAELERGTGRHAAYYVVADRFGVSDRTIRRAVERAAKID